MKALIIGATGFVGGPILAEALSRPELEMTAILRDPAKLGAHDRLATIAGSIDDSDALAKACSGHDAVIHAYHPGRSVPADQVHDRSVAGHKAIIAATRKAGVPRLLCVGGAASLTTPEGKEYIDSSLWDPEFDPYKQSILGTRALYYLLKPVTDIDWVFLAPSAWLRPGERTGRFRIAKNDMLFGPDGTSRISLEDYALAMVDELVTPRHHRERFTVGY
jgi:putative NADH-flavin reductase